MCVTNDFFKNAWRPIYEFFMQVEGQEIIAEIS